MAQSSDNLMETNLESPAQTFPNPESWQEKYLQPTIIALLMLAFFSGFVVVIATIAPDSPYQFLPWLILLVAAESIFTTRWLALSDNKVNRFYYRTAEITVILLFLRLFIWLFITGLPGDNQVEGFFFEPSSFLDPVFLVFSILLFFVWQQTVTMYSTFLDLQLEDEEVYYYNIESYERHKISRPELKNRRQIFEGFFRQWVVGGLILGILATATTFDLAPIAQGATLGPRTISRLGLRPEMLASLLVYFVGGLWLAGQGHLATMRGRWLIQDIKSDPTITRNWHRASLLLILIVAAIAAFLPIGSTVAISRILQLIALVIVVAVNFLFSLIALLLFLIASVLLPNTGRESSEPLDLSNVVPQELLFPPPAEPTPSPILGILFWIVVGVAVNVALLFFLRGRGVNISGTSFVLALTTTWNRFTTWLSSLWNGVNKQVQSIGQTIRERLQISEKPAVNNFSWGRPSFRSLTPRQKIRYYYLSVVRRAEEKGLERGKSETPSEYAADLKEHWPEADGEVEAITEAFLKARYSPKPLTGEDIGPVKETWNRIKSTIRKRRR